MQLFMKGVFVCFCYQAPIIDSLQSFYQLMSNEEKESIMTLPPAERVVAVALKHIFDQIKKLGQEEGLQSQKAITSFTGRFKEIQQKAASVIKGAPIPLEDLKDREKYFSAEDAPKIDPIAKNNKPIKDYWLTVLENFFDDGLTDADKQIAKAISNISSDVDEEKMQVIVELNKNDWLKSGKVTRTFYTNEGQPGKAETQGVSWLQKKPEGLIAKLIDGGNTAEDSANALPLVGEIINDMIPYSLQFYLGMGDEIDDEDMEEIDEDEEDEQEDEGPKKKVKD